jgi:LysM repeat protein
VALVVGLSACYKDAGDNVQPTSNQVNLTDIAPPTPTQPVLPTPTPQALTPTRTSIPTLVPTTTPADSGSVGAPAVEPTDTPLAAQPPANPTQTSQFAPSFTPAIVESPTPQGPVIETPGLSDIQPSNTPPPTLDPNNMPTPTPIPVEENPCIHVVQPNDTLYSIAQSNEVLLADLVAANADLLWAGQNTTLQIGWQLDIPGCASGEPTLAPTTEGEMAGDTTPPAPGEQIIHVVQSGDTVFSIGRQYGVDPYLIIDANNLANPDVLQPGQQLVIPAQ